MRRRRVGRWKRYVTAFLLGAAILAVAVWSALPALVERHLLRQLESAGVAAPRLTVTAVGFTEARIEGVRLGAAGEVAAGEVVASYGIDGLFGLRLVRVGVRGLRVAARIEPGGISFGGLLRPDQAGDGAALDAALLRNLPPLSVEDGRIDLATPVGPVTLPFRGTASLQPDGSVVAPIAMQLESQLARARGNLSLRLAGEGLAAELTIEEGTAALAEGVSSAFAGRAHLDLTEGQGLQASADLALSETELAEIAFPAGTLALAASPAKWSARLALSGADGTSDVQADLAISEPRTRPRLSASGSLTAAAGAWVWPLLGLPQPERGNARLAARAAGPLPEIELPSGSPATAGDLLRLLAGGDVAGSAEIELADLVFPEATSIATAHAAVDVEAAGGQIALMPRAAVRDVTIAEPLRRGLDTPGALTDLLAGPLTANLTLVEPLRLVIGEDRTTADADLRLRVAAESGTALELDLRGKATLSDALSLIDFALEDGNAHAAGALFRGANWVDIEIAGSAVGRPDRVDGAFRVAGNCSEIDAETLKVGNLALDAAVDVALADGRLSLHLREDGTATAQNLSGPLLAGTVKELRLSIRAGEAPLLVLELPEGAPPTLAYDLQLGPVKATLPLLVGGPKPLPLAASLPETRWAGRWSAADGHRAAAGLTDAAFALPSLAVTAQGVRADLAFEPGRASAEFRVAAIAHSGKPAPLVPLALAGTAEMAEGRLTFDGVLRDKAGHLELAVGAAHTLADRVGKARLKMTPLAFAPGRLQPQDIAPAIGPQVEEVTGEAAIGGSIAWDERRLSSDLQLLLRDISFRSPQLDVLGLNSVVAIDRLVPFTTRPGQQLSAGLVDVGLPLTDLLAAFRIEAGPRLVIESARLSLAGGEVAMPAVAVDLADPRTDLALDVRNVDLARLMELAQIEGLTATGSLSGRIPVSVGAEGVAIRDALLAAAGEGTLRYAPGTASSALLGGGESVELALQALSNFHYSGLTLTVNRDAAGETEALMQVKGSNPDFYGGHPVEFNLNVTGRLDEILHRGLAGYRVPDAIRERLREFGE